MNIIDEPDQNSTHDDTDDPNDPVPVALRHRYYHIAYEGYENNAENDGVEVVTYQEITTIPDAVHGERYVSDSDSDSEDSGLSLML